MARFWGHMGHSGVQTLTAASMQYANTIEQQFLYATSLRCSTYGKKYCGILTKMCTRSCTKYYSLRNVGLDDVYETFCSLVGRVYSSM